MSSGTTDQYRDIAIQLVQRAEKDETFAKQAKADPVGTLTAAGIPAGVASEMLKGGGGEVSGYLRPEGGDCADTTCWVSMCPGTCYVSI